MSNRLSQETSPYLLQHAENPVDWYPWGEEAFAMARQRDVPILLSVGYSSCHWCHVMERESFEDNRIASIMNDRFVNVKVDREERPDVDSVYMTAVQAMTGQGGWPMTVFITPDGRPFYGGTYFPPEDRGGLPAFDRVLLTIADAFTGRRGDVVASGQQLVARIADTFAARRPSEPLRAEMLDRALRILSNQFDDTSGGFGLQPKFPQPATLEFLLRYHVRRGFSAALEMVELTFGQDGGRRYTRPDWRRLSPVLYGRVLAGATLREDAVRQRAVDPALHSTPIKSPGTRATGGRRRASLTM